MNTRQQNVAQYCDGQRTSKQIAELCGDSHKYVQEVALKFDLPRRKRGSATGSLNASYRGGRRIDRDGYVLTSAPADHPHARMRQDRPTGIILEHRLIVEQKLGRYLLPTEIVDHIDGLRLHNAPTNLRVFPSNAAHLKATITGQKPVWSAEGLANMYLLDRQKPGLIPVRTYQKMKASGDARLIQILLTTLKLGVTSPYLLGTSHHTTKAGISDFSRSNLEHELQRIYQRYA